MEAGQYRLVDTHAHICDKLFDKDRANILSQAREEGISAVIAVGENLADAKKNLELAFMYKELLPAAGLYPTYLDMEKANEMAQFIRKYRDRLWAVGEVGLDYWAVQKEKDQERQKETFSLFIELAQELGLPLNVHSRSAGRQAISLLLEKGADKVQMHAFDGKASAAGSAVEAGYFFSIPPSVVRSRQKQKLVEKLPLSSILLESDSPVLGSEPKERNVPANVLVSAQTIAGLQGRKKEEVLERVAENFARLYL